MLKDCLRDTLPNVFLSGEYISFHNKSRKFNLCPAQMSEAKVHNY